MFKITSQSLVIALGLVAFASVLFSNFADVESSYQNCVAIEKLKKAELTQAETSYSRFDASLKLLNIQKTDEIIRIRDENINFARDNFGPADCKRFYLPFINSPNTRADPAPPTVVPFPPKTTTSTTTTP